MQHLLSNRALLGQAPRIVIKIGSSSLTRGGSLARDQIAQLVDVLGPAHVRGQQIVLVSSGSIAAGLQPLGFRRRPADVRDQQAASMVGQSHLIQAYTDEFARYGVTIGQALLTPDDVVDRRHYNNVQSALQRLLHLGVIPIVNENDAVVTDELRFGDNDRLAALVAHIVDATALILLTDVDGLYSGPPGTPGATLISEVADMDELAGFTITGKGSEVGTGGMATKVEAARIATSGGVATLLASTADLGAALAGETVGTWFLPRSKRIPARDLWLRHAAAVKGTITVDDGAKNALRSGGASLLAVGVTDVRGTIAAGDLVSIVDSNGVEVARGLSAFSTAELNAYMHKRSAPRPVVHADDLVLPTK
ncbi:glutamate 5-kinase [Trueperella bialowiezensis]|uniref:glutamate 5-kinase n=1 Tax=Trueperella bialowiezensis TaxID=312285 RepID=UPI00389A867F